MAFDPDGLDSGGVEARVVTELFEECACALDARVGIVLVDDGSFANHVIPEDQSAGARKFDGPIEVVRVVRLVSVEEDEVEGRGIFRIERGERIERGTDADVDL